MKQFIGIKKVKAEPMTAREFENTHGKKSNADTLDDEGYRVVYPDDYVSWCPKEQFEEANTHIGDLRGKDYSPVELLNRLEELLGCNIVCRP